MNITQKLKQPNFYSSVEQAIVDYVLQNPDFVLSATSQELADITYTSSSSVVRLCQKLQCKGFNDFKIKYASEKEQNYFEQKYIDANFPFKKGDDIKTIAKNISNLNIESIQETMSLLDEDTYEKAINLLYNAEIIDIYGVSINLQLAHDFKYKLSRINRRVEIQSFQQQQLLNAARSTPNHCALILSYTGETKEVLEVLEMLRPTKTPIICITSMGNNSLAQASDLVLNIVSKEKLYSKIGQFSSRTSILMVLDFLYAGIFEKDYINNIEYLIKINKRITKINSRFEPIHEE